MTRVIVPYRPRDLQSVIHTALESHRFSVAVCHRRFGKTVAAVNHLQKAALLCRRSRPRFAYVAPTYRQGKAIAWDYMKHYASVVPDHQVNESELRIDYPNGAQIRIYGADNPDALRGIYLDGVVLDEYGLMPPNIFSEVLRPTLTDRQGWAFFIGTPNGKNQFYEVIYGTDAWCGAKDDPDWWYGEFKASQTGVIADRELLEARQSMTRDEYDQEFECSFEASVKGAIYAREVLATKEGGRVTRVPYDPTLLVDTDWDLGVGDATAIWFTQSLAQEVRVIDFYEASDQGLPHFKQVLTDKGYTYGAHWAPHDIQVREFTSGHSRWEVASKLGLNFQITPRNEKLGDGIHNTKMLFPRCWFDAEACRRGLEALQHYRWQTRDGMKNPTSEPQPVHDWSSHAADAFRGLATRHYHPKRQPERQAAKDLRLSQKEKDPYDLRWRRPQSAGRGGY